MEIPEGDKFALTFTILHITRDAIQMGQSVECLTNYGIDLLFMLLQPSSSKDDLKYALAQRDS